MLEDHARRRTQLDRRELLMAGSALALTTAVHAPAAAQPKMVEPTLLYPHESATRDTRDLSGLWKFKLDPEDAGETAGWFRSLTGARTIPVPCSWNDLFDDARNYFGQAWYQLDFEVADAWAARQILLRFGAVSYRAKAWLNGKLLGEHEGAHLPFVFDATDLVAIKSENRLVVMVENKLRLDRVPAIPDPDTAKLHTHHFPQTTYDFFPYAGIHRPVWLMAVPRVHVEDVTVVTTLAGTTGVVDLDLAVATGWSGPVRATLDGGAGKTVEGLGSVQGGRGKLRLRIADVRAWGPEDPFLYKLTIRLGDGLDEYTMKVGVRTIAVKGRELLLNDKPVFLRGFGKHEDFPLHGRGLDLPSIIRDFELLKWVGANSFRTSHYPYSEEAMMLADEYGLLVIDETPAVSLVFMDSPRVLAARYTTLAASLDRLVKRDKNHPCVILWSLANEPLDKPFQTLNQAPPSAIPAGTEFFTRLFAHARGLDRTRPVALVSVHWGPPEWVGLGDIICTNSYNGWYGISGRLDDAEKALNGEIETLKSRHPNKPIMYTEFGADAIAGMHANPPEMWSEEYQAELIDRYLRTIAKHKEVIGSHPWAFADFRTPQGVLRAGALNHKGVFTRDRRPKLAADLLRRRWTASAK
ncbi:MAG TPA: beta-glucuronidase [Sphingomonas sp.]